MNPEVTAFINAWATWYMIKTTKRETYTTGSSVWICKNQAFISIEENKTHYLNFKNENVSPMYFTEKACMNAYSLT